MYITYVIAFDRAGLWNFGIDFAKNAVIFGRDSNSSYTNNRNNNFVVPGEGLTYGINGSFGSPENIS